jgi:membrane-associated protease RseP (regulator of RpoE activity)
MRRVPLLHLTLFVLTFFSTLVAGAVFQKGINILKEPLRITEGLPFSMTLMGILLSHELSHFFASKRHHTKATLPYFIPAPITLIGTFGAFIKMKSPIVTRKALIDIGVSGPIAGFLLSLVASVIGLAYSTVVPLTKAREGVLSLGDSLLFNLLSYLVVGTVPHTHEILLHPVAFAGWIGFFVTSLNLIPVGQLDGGHVAYAFLKERHRVVSVVLVSTLILFGLFFWEGWALWGVLMVVLGIKHPPIIYWEVPLDGRRRMLGLVAFFILLITFIPSPFKIL